MQVHIPASWVTQGYGVPEVCARHGQPAVHRKKIDINVYPAYIWLFLLGGLILFFILGAIAAKTLTLPAWPICDRCVRRRKKMIAASFAVLALGIVAFCGALGLRSVGPKGLVVGVVVMAAALIPAWWARWPSVAAVRANQERTWVTVTKAHAAFEAQFAPYRVHLEAPVQQQVQQAA